MILQSPGTLIPLITLFLHLSPLVSGLCVLKSQVIFSLFNKVTNLQQIKVKVPRMSSVALFLFFWVISDLELLFVVVELCALIYLFVLRP